MSNTCCIHIIGLARGGESPYDDHYVRRYDPTYHPPGEEYDGGLLLTTPNRDEARQFESIAEAVAYWRQSHVVRGKCEKPLTAWTVEIS